MRPPVQAIRWRPGAARDLVAWPMIPVRWHPGGCWLPETRRPAAHPAFGAGEYVIQDPSSLLAVTLLEPQPGELVCDLCAAPGGKATALLEAIGNDGWLLANEPIESRLAALEFNLARHGSRRYCVTSRDPDWLAEIFSSSFDAVLVDAPCSGQSLLGRGKRDVSAFREATVRHCAARQARILAAAARLVRPGGRLVYSTCTFADAENEALIERFLEADHHFAIAASAHLAAWESALLPGSYRLWPHRDGCGGAFAVCLRKEEPSTFSLGEPTARDPISEGLLGSVRRRGAHRGPSGALGGRCSLASFWQPEWGALHDADFVAFAARMIGWPPGLPAGWAEIACGGPEVAYRAGETWFPAYALAMRRAADWHPAQTTDLSDDLARRYLTGEIVPASVSGWSVATWQGRALGWLKSDGVRGKNHLPKQGRLAF